MSKIVFPLLRSEYEAVVAANINCFKDVDDASISALSSMCLSSEIIQWPLLSISNSEKATISDLRSFRERLINKLSNSGINLTDPSDKDTRSIMDKVCVEFFSEYFCEKNSCRGKDTWISPAEAANPQMWKFINCFVIPDIVFWRWGNTSERFFDGRRSYSYNMWIRAYYFRKLPFYGRINEDMYQAIVERTTIMTYSKVVPILAEKMLEIKNRKLYRRLASSVLAMSKNVDFLCKPDEDIRDFIDAMSKKINSSDSTSSVK